MPHFAENVKRSCDACKRCLSLRVPLLFLLYLCLPACQGDRVALKMSAGAPSSVSGPHSCQVTVDSNKSSSCQRRPQPAHAQLLPGNRVASKTRDLKHRLRSLSLASVFWRFSRGSSSRTVGGGISHCPEKNQYLNLCL